jgi:hypothetical protein
MPSLFDVKVDGVSLVAMLDRVGPSVGFHCREVARDTAKRIVAEAQRRLDRAAPPETHKTEKGIHWEMTRDEQGYVVLGYEAGGNESPVDYYLEHGTKYMYARPWFFSSAILEQGPHLERLAETIQTVLDDLGR